MQATETNAVPRSTLSRTRVIGRLAVALTAVSLLAACEADTLYDVQDGEVNVNLTPLAVSVSTESQPRMELSDSIRVHVTVRDLSGKRGIATVGTTVRVRHSGGTTTTLQDSRNFSPAETGTVSNTFTFALPVTSDAELPDSLSLEVFGFATDSQGLCVAAVKDSEQRLSCDTVDGATVAADAVGQASDVLAVRGRTIDLPASGTIADAVVDVSRQRLYLSNQTRHRLEVLDIPTSSFRPFVEVGSEPWGLALNRTSDTLLVANSGGTSISYVPLGTLNEDVSRRLNMPNAVLFQVNVNNDEQFRSRYLVTPIDFSDRPEFLAQDYRGRVFFSTLPTVTAPQGTIRYTDPNPDPTSSQDVPEVKFLDYTYTPSATVWSFANIDSVKVTAFAAGDDQIVLYDHKPGFPAQVIQSILARIENAVPDLQSKGSDIVAVPGTFQLFAAGFGDTTFVSVSGDRHVVAFGEGARSPAGRIYLYNAQNDRISASIEVIDLFHNAAEQVHGLDLNFDGSFGVARGSEAAYFFTEQLRLQGEYSPGVSGGAGAAFQPGNAPTTPPYAFIGTTDASIKAVDTTHFLPRAEIPIKANITGPMRVSGPLASDNAGLSCPGNPQCVVAKLYGITASGGVVLVNVRARDLQ